MSLCDDCPAFLALNPHEIKGGEPVKHCIYGERPEIRDGYEYCRRRREESERLREEGSLPGA